MNFHISRRDFPFLFNIKKDKRHDIVSKIFKLGYEYYFKVDNDTISTNDDIKMKFETLDIDTTQFIEKRDSDRHGIDLKKANSLLLQSVGVPESNIYITDYATSENLDYFFSYRVEKGQTGRMLAFIGRKQGDS